MYVYGSGQQGRVVRDEGLIRGLLSEKRMNEWLEGNRMIVHITHQT